jgi:hypothetical protein
MFARDMQPIHDHGASRDAGNRINPARRLEADATADKEN